MTFLSTKRRISVLADEGSLCFSSLPKDICDISLCVWLHLEYGRTQTFPEKCNCIAPYLVQSTYTDDGTFPLVPVCSKCSVWLALASNSAVPFAGLLRLRVCSWCSICPSTIFCLRRLSQAARRRPIRGPGRLSSAGQTSGACPIPASVTSVSCSPDCRIRLIRQIRLLPEAGARRRHQEDVRAGPEGLRMLDRGVQHSPDSGQLLSSLQLLSIGCHALRKHQRRSSSNIRDRLRLLGALLRAPRCCRASALKPERAKR